MRTLTILAILAAGTSSAFAATDTLTLSGTPVLFDSPAGDASISEFLDSPAVDPFGAGFDDSPAGDPFGSEFTDSPAMDPWLNSNR